MRGGGTVSRVTGSSPGQEYVLGLDPRLNLLLTSHQWQMCSSFKRAQSFGVESPILNNVFMARNKVYIKEKKKFCNFNKDRIVMIEIYFVNINFS